MTADKLMWRTVDAVEAVLNARLRPPKVAEHFVYKDDVIHIVAETGVIRPDGKWAWSFTLKERGRPSKIGPRLVGTAIKTILAVDIRSGPFCLDTFNQTACKRVIPHLEKLAALELLAEI